MLFTQNKLLVSVLLCLSAARGDDFEDDDEGEFEDNTPAPHAVNKCDVNIMAAIKHLWGDNTPRKIIDMSQAAGKEVVLFTSPGYFPNDTQCVYSVFDNKSFTLTFEFSDGFVTYLRVKVEERDGVLVDTAKGTKYYRVYSKEGVSAYYRCHDQGKDKKPQGVVQVSEASYDKSSLSEAVSVMDGLGISMAVELSPNCQTIPNTDHSFNDDF